MSESEVFLLPFHPLQLQQLPFLLAPKAPLSSSSRMDQAFSSEFSKLSFLGESILLAFLGGSLILMIHTGRNG